MPRRKDDRAFRRFQFRLEEGLEQVCDSYSLAELNQIFNQALRTIDPVPSLGLTSRVLLRPQEPKTFSVCRVLVNSQIVRLVFPEKRDDFRDIAVRYRYEWKDWCWQRTIPTTGNIVDRAAEITNEMLLAGFCVQVEHSTIKERAIAASYTPEPFRLIKSSTHSTYNGWFVVSWPRNEDWYNRAMKITCAKYVDGMVRVPPEQFMEVQDFAEEHGFALTDAAKAIAAQAQADWDAAVICSPKDIKAKPRKAKNFEEVEVEVPDALIDDDA